MRNQLCGLLASMLLAACGGGSGDGDDDVLDVDAAVVDHDAAPADAEEPTCPEPITVFLNFGGGDYLDGTVHDSSTNTTSILTGNHTIPAYAGAIDVDALVACVREQVAPFHIEVTTTDPGAAAHREIVYVDGSESIGFQSGISNIAPYVCPTAGEDSTPRSIGFGAVHLDRADDRLHVRARSRIPLPRQHGVPHRLRRQVVRRYGRPVRGDRGAHVHLRRGDSYQRIADIAGLACDAR